MTIKLHDLRPAPGSKTKRTRVGRGDGSKGKTAGRGTKGTKARKNVPSTFEGGQMPIHMRLPKLKGFRNRFRTEYEVVNVGDIDKLFPKGGDVGVDELVAAARQKDEELARAHVHGFHSYPARMHPLTARLFGFRSAIAHGMWTKARCLAALQPRLPDAFTVEVAFKKPILLPAAVEFCVDPGAAIQFGARDPHTGVSHLGGHVAT